MFWQRNTIFPNWLYGLLCSIAVLSVIAGCKQQSSGAPADLYSFYYYPKLNVYYDKANGEFLYSTNGWQDIERRKTTPEFAANLDTKVNVTSPAADVWMNNEEHRNRFGGIQTDYSPRSKKAFRSDRDQSTESVSFEQENKERKKRHEEGKRQREKRREEPKKGKDFFKELKEKIKDIGRGN